jgi:DNA (cytosine-5)-methyltransferase 1
MRDLATQTPDLALSYLSAARKQHSQAEIARFLQVDVRTVRRWEARQTQPPNYLTAALQQILPLHITQTTQGSFDFIDLFAGIGGLRAGFESNGGRCVFTSEYDSYAQKTYAENFSGGHDLAGDITHISASMIPDHDLLLAGFPCQPFSIAGVSKKNALGKAHGFACEAQGTLFFDVARIIEAKRPRAFLLENVKNLQSHDQGRTFEVITRTLAEELGYQIHVKIVDGAHFVPQHRERIYIVGFREPAGFDWAALRLPDKKHTLAKILHRTDGSEPVLSWDEGKYFDHSRNKVIDKYTLTDHLWRYLQNYAEKHRARGNGFGFGLVGPDSIARTLSARYYKDGSEILIYQSGNKNPRRLTPRECARLMGYPDSFRIPVSDTRAYKQFGNSVVVPVIKAISNIMLPWLAKDTSQQTSLPLSVKPRKIEKESTKNPKSFTLQEA